MIDNEYSGKLFIPSREYERIEALVVDLYEEAGVTEAPIDAFAIARKKKYLLKPFTQLKNVAIREVYGLSTDGFSLYDPEKQCFVIFYDNLQCKERQRFTIMHEIGHILLGHKAACISCHMQRIHRAVIARQEVDVRRHGFGHMYAKSPVGSNFQIRVLRMQSIDVIVYVTAEKFAVIFPVFLKIRVAERFGDFSL